MKKRFCLGDLVTRTGEREIIAKTRRLPDNPGELACMQPNDNQNVRL